MEKEIKVGDFVFSSMNSQWDIIFFKVARLTPKCVELVEVERNIVSAEEEYNITDEEMISSFRSKRVTVIPSKNVKENGEKILVRFSNNNYGLRLKYKKYYHFYLWKGDSKIIEPMRIF